MSELYLKALQDALPLRLAMEPIRNLEERQSIAESEVRRIEVKLIELKDQNSDIQTIERVAISLGRERDFVVTLKAERDRQRSLFRSSRIKYAKEIFEVMRPVHAMIVRLVSSLRKELSLSSDEAEFLAQLADMEQRAMAVLNRVFAA
jgi:hypothetical protein